jgi:pimeloyl-ACP methyl ester carboxylesterase
MPYLQTNEIQTYYEIHGAGVPLVLLHGALVDQRMWQPQLAPFSAAYQVLVYDMRGHGRTGASSKLRYTAQLFADDLHALLQALELEQVMLCGLSLGGMIAQRYAATYPERISALILCDTAVSTTLTFSDKVQRYTLAWSLAPSVRLMGARHFVDYAFWLAKVTRGEAWFGQNQLVRDYVYGCMQALETAEMAKIYDLITGLGQSDLAQLQAPTLILNGEYESASVFYHTKYLQQHIPNVRAEIIPDAGHTSNMENPEAFNRAVLEFLAEVAGDRSESLSTSW